MLQLASALTITAGEIIQWTQTAVSKVTVRSN